MSDPGRMLHVTNGDCAGTGIAATGLGGEILSWNDTLHEGPVPGGLGAHALRRERARFLAGCGWGEADSIEAGLRARDDRLAAAFGREPVVLWFEHDLYDQLQLIQILAMMPPEANVEAVLADRYLGNLTPAEFAALWPRRAAVTGAQRTEACRAWEAFRAPVPLDVQRLLDDEPPRALPHLAAALRRSLEELPATGDGLSRSERQALQAIAAGAGTPAEAFVAAQRAEEALFLGDAWFWRRLSELGAGEARLVETESGAPPEPPPPAGDEKDFMRTRLRLTPRGGEVMAGAADRAAGPALDRWIGGAHVTGPRPAWRWDRATGRVVETATGSAPPPRPPSPR